MMQELILEADRMNLPLVQSFIDEQLEAVDCPMPTRIAIDVAVEELFVNIASYAYGDGTGKAVAGTGLQKHRSDQENAVNGQKDHKSGMHSNVDLLY